MQKCWDVTFLAVSHVKTLSHSLHNGLADSELECSSSISWWQWGYVDVDVRFGLT